MDNSKKQFDGAFGPIKPTVKIFEGTPKLGYKRSHKTAWILATISITICAVILLLTGIIVFKSLNISAQSFVGKQNGLFGKIGDMLRGGTGNLKLQGETSGQINILLLGIGGENHDGGYLTDTILLAQIRPNEGQISLVSIPRDYLAKMPNLGELKINSAFALEYAKNHDWNKAGQASLEAVSKISNLTIPYFAVIDFSGFEKAIDEVGGLDINIERTFTDYSYPDSKEGYLPPQTFKQGFEHMDGKRALIFARSRHAAGPEGSDFSRSQRQHKILEALKDKLSSLNIVHDTATINKLLSVFAGHFHTNLSPGEILHAYTLINGYSKDNISTLNLDPSTNLICPQILESNGAYVLTPCPGKTDKDIEDFFKHSFIYGKLAGETSTVWIATNNAGGLAYKQTEKKLLGSGITAWPIEYSDVTPEDTVVYKINDKPATLEYLKNVLQAREVTLPPPNIKIDGSKTDFILILGKNIRLDPVPKADPPKPKSNESLDENTPSNVETQTQVKPNGTGTEKPTPTITNMR